MQTPHSRQNKTRCKSDGQLGFGAHSGKGFAQETDGVLIGGEWEKGPFWCGGSRSTGLGVKGCGMSGVTGGSWLVVGGWGTKGEGNMAAVQTVSTAHQMRPIDISRLPDCTCSTGTVISAVHMRELRLRVRDLCLLQQQGMREKYNDTEKVSIKT